MQQPIPIQTQKPLFYGNQQPHLINYPQNSPPQFSQQPPLARIIGGSRPSQPIYTSGMPQGPPPFPQNIQREPVQAVRGPLPGSVVRGAPPVIPGSRVIGSPFGGYPVYYIAAPERPRMDYNPNFNYEEANFLCDTTIV